MNDPRGQLVFECKRLLEELKPKYFLFENVNSMSKENKAFITNLFGIDFVDINSSLVSAQQRRRIYWVGKRNQDGSYSKINIHQPEDQHIYLKDIIETGEVDRLKSYCIDASYYKGTNLETYLRKAKRQLVFEKPDRVGQIGKGGQGDRIYSIDGKSVALSANGGGRGALTGLYLTETEKEYNVLDSMLAKKEGTLSYKKAIQNTKSLEDKAKTLTAGGQTVSNSGATNLIYCVAQRGRHINEEGKRQDILNANTEQRFEPRFDGKTNCLTTVQKDNYICEDSNIENDISDFVIRKLTPTECELLQTFPAGHTEGVSDTQRYKALGNSFTVKVIEHILKNMEL